MTDLTHAALDAIFEPRNGTTKRADVGIEVDGVDISNRYYSRLEGGSDAADQNIESGGFDISVLFAALGSVGQPNAVDPGDRYVHGMRSSGTASATLTMNTDGDAVYTANIAQSGTGTVQWTSSDNQLDTSEWECRADLVSGTLTSGNVGVWQTLSGIRVFSVSRSVNLSKICVFDMTVREIANPSNSATFRVTLEAEVEAF